MYQRINTTHLVNGGINTLCILGEYSTALIRDGKAYLLGYAETEDEARAMHKKWADHYKAQDAENA